MYVSVITELQLPFFFSSRRRHTRFSRDWSSDVCSSDLEEDPDQDRRDREGRVATGNAAAAKTKERKAARALALAGSKADPARDFGQRHDDERSDPLGTRANPKACADKVTPASRNAAQV